MRGDAVDTTDDEWRTVMQTNVDGVFYLSRAFAQQLVYDGAIVSVSSTCGVVGAAGLAAYCTSKGALNQLTRTMALELADKQINVNAVHPARSIPRCCFPSTPPRRLSIRWSSAAKRHSDW